MCVGAGEQAGERYAVCVGDQVVLATELAPVDRARPGLVAPKSARSEAESQTARERSSRSAWRSRSRLSEMLCPNCGSENPESAKFCNGCGGSLLPVCSSCGTSNASGARFCSECGASLAVDVTAATPTAAAAAPRATPAAERRLVSVLFADLVGFTTLSESRDAEEVRELLSRYFDTC